MNCGSGRGIECGTKRLPRGGEGDRRHGNPGDGGVGEIDRGSATAQILKPVRKPDVRNPFVWFDARGGETLRCYMASAIFPRLNSNA